MSKATRIRVAERFLLKKTAIDSKIIEVAKTVSAFLRENNVRHAIAGGMAVALYGYLRNTKDVDIVIPATALDVVEKLGKTKLISGHLTGVSVKVSGIDVDFLFLGKGLRSKDIAAPKEFADLPVIGIVPLVVMKLETGRMKDSADITELLKLGVVPIASVSKRLSAEDRKDFNTLVEIAKLENQGDMKKARRMLLAPSPRR